MLVSYEIYRVEVFVKLFTQISYNTISLYEYVKSITFKGFGDSFYFETQ